MKEHGERTYRDVSGYMYVDGLGLWLTEYEDGTHTVQLEAEGQQWWPETVITAGQQEAMATELACQQEEWMEARATADIRWYANNIEPHDETEAAAIKGWLAGRELED